jgi:hypothetical protein
MSSDDIVKGASERKPSDTETLDALVDIVKEVSELREASSRAVKNLLQKMAIGDMGGVNLQTDPRHNPAHRWLDYILSERERLERNPDPSPKTGGYVEIRFLGESAEAEAEMEDQINAQIFEALLRHCLSQLHTITERMQATQADIDREKELTRSILDNLQLA